MNSILVGNGLNLEIDHSHSLSNRSILYRMNQNFLQKEYSSIFEETVTSAELKSLLSLHARLLPDILSGEFDKYIEDESEEAALTRIRKQYKRSSSQYDIGMEDYFFIMRLEQKRAGYNKEAIFQAAAGLKWLFLDAIYNDGKTQQLASHIKKTDFYRKQKVFSRYDNLFTVNYDCNLEIIAGKTVYYLHGDFRTLGDQYSKGSLQEYCERKKGNNTVAPDVWRHIYCNAIMGFSGPEKEYVQWLYNNFDNAVKQLREYIRIGIIKQKEDIIPYLTNVKRENHTFVINCVDGLLEDPTLSVRCYPSDVFKNIEGVLDIVGLSPNNDDHIWKAIKENEKLERVRFYYHSEKDREMAEFLGDERMEIVPVRGFW